MAVQAQYPSDSPLFNRSEQERKEMDFSSQNPNGFLGQPSSIFFGNNGRVNVNQRRRRRESSIQMVPTPQMNLFSLRPPSISTQIVHPSLVSTGLHLSFDDSDQSQSLASLINQQGIEIDQYLIAQGEQLRRTLADKAQAHYRALLAAAEEAAARRLKKKELELNRAAKGTAELEAQIARIRNEALTWQAKATSDQAAAAALRAQIQQVQRATVSSSMPERCGGGCSSDAGSAHVDPNRVEEDPKRACRVCGVSEVSVLLLPCRHLCLCTECDGAIGDSDAVRCPVCNAVSAGRFQVLLP